MQAAGTPLLCVVLDTNAVLDWRLFGHPAMAPVGDRIQAGALQWLGTQAMRDELGHAASRAVLARWRPDVGALLAHWDRWCQPLREPTPMPVHRLRCRDPDDQVFLDLAMQAGASLLISRDRDLLSLARRAARLTSGALRIATPEQAAALLAQADWPALPGAEA